MSQIYKNFSKDKYQIIYPVTPEYDGQRLDQFLMSYFENFSRQAIKKKIDRGEVKIKGRPFPHKPSVKVYQGEDIEIVTYNDGIEDEFWRGVKIHFQNPQVIFEDNDLLVINKPPFMATHPTGKHLFNCATVYYESIYSHTIHSIHRLDRETSGVLVMGKNPKATQKITTLFENSLVNKCYFFIAHKNQMATTLPFTANENMGPRDDFLPRNYVHCFEDERGKTASTHFELIEQYDNYVLGLAFPKTGRQHQIRTHAAFHGYPLLGDKMYNGDPRIFMRFKDEIATTADHDKMQIPRHALHAIALKFRNHPKYNRFFQAPLPQDLCDWIEQNLYLEIADLEEKIKEKLGVFFKN